MATKKLQRDLSAKANQKWWAEVIKAAKAAPKLTYEKKYNRRTTL